MNSAEISEKLEELKAATLKELLSIFEAKGITSLNMYEYWSMANTDRYTFYDTDNDGYGVALFVDKLYLNSNGDGIVLDMLTADDSDWGEWTEDNLTAVEMNYVLAMVEEIVEVAEEEYNGRFMKADEDFDDLEEE